MFLAMRPTSNNRSGSSAREGHGVQSRGTDVLCIGETMALVAPDPPVALRDAERLRLGAAGAESNVAVWLAGLGSATQWCGRVGDDPLGQRVLRELQSAGVGIETVVIDEMAPTAVYFKDPGREGTKVWYYRRGSAGSRLDVADVTRALKLRPSIVHLSGVTPALSASCAAAMEHVMRAARDRGVIISFDVNHRPGLWFGSGAAGKLQELAAMADIVFVGCDEAASLWGTVTDDDVRELLPDVATVIVKDGAASATSFDDRRVTRVPALAVEVSEPVGAGDAFAAGYLRGRLLAMAPERCLRLGHLVAGRALSTTADTAAPTAPGELEALAVSGAPW